MTFYNILERELLNLNTRSKLFKILKRELLRLGYWKNKARGKPDIKNFYPIRYKNVD